MLYGTLGHSKFCYRVCQFKQRQRTYHVTVRQNPENYETSAEFKVQDYYEAHVKDVRQTEKHGQVLHLRLVDGQDSILPVYIGEFEGAAIAKEMQHRKAIRPLIYDLMKNSLEVLQYKVSRVCINALVNNTYHARVHFQCTNGIDQQEYNIDARPSDALNLALRFEAPIYVNKDIASIMALAKASYQEDYHAINASCMEELLHHSDPTVMLKLRMQIASQEERFEEAAQLQKELDGKLASDRLLSLMVAMEAALEDKRYEEAARYRDELKLLRAQSQQAKQRREE